MLSRRFIDPFDSLFAFEPRHLNGRNNDYYHSKTKLESDSKGFDLRIEVPGYGKEDLEVFVEHQVLYIKTKDKDPILLETLQLSKDVDLESIKVKCEKGILSVSGKVKKELIERKLLTIS